LCKYTFIDFIPFSGNVTAAMDVKRLESLGITHILTVDSIPLPSYVTDLPKLTVRYIQAADMPKEDLLSMFPDCIQYIKDILESGKKILVHCYYGISRSATIVIAFVMEKYKLSYEKALQR
jgi:dual specificity phosphatase 12